MTPAPTNTSDVQGLYLLVRIWVALVPTVWFIAELVRG